MKKYFVEIIASNKQQLVQLQKFELDLFSPTVKSIENEFSIEGLVTLDQVSKLVENGFKVIMKKEAVTKTPATEESMPFGNWVEIAEKGFEVESKEGTTELSSSMLPFTGYLSSEGIDSAIRYISKNFPLITELITLPKKTHQGRICKTIKIGTKNNVSKKGILLIGGVHAREVVNADLLVKLAFSLCKAFDSKTGLTFGGKSFTFENIKQVVENIDLFVFPLANPDGRVYVQSPTGDVWWRKNRNPNPGLPAKGVDLNRNYDFLWHSGIGTSADPSSEIFKGTAPNSEPETKNVIHLVNTYNNIICVLDIHSYSELILYPWGDDETQTHDPDMNFLNPVYDGVRGHLGDSDYREYIHKKDLDSYIFMGNKIKNAISSVRGKNYKVIQSMNLYPTTGTCHDFLYSLKFNGVKRDIFGYTIETGTRFQPSYSEATKVMSEVSTGLVEICLELSK